MQQTLLSLSATDRRRLEAFRAKGMHRAREFNRAHILAVLDRGVREAQIMEMLGVGRTAIWRTRAAYLEGGLEFALHDVPRPGKPKRYRTDNEAKVVALACAEPPAGAKHWTVVLLAKYVLVGWVQRFSNLIIKFHLEIMDIGTAKVVDRWSIDIRGNTDKSCKSWRDGADYLIRQMSIGL